MYVKHFQEINQYIQCSNGPLTVKLQNKIIKDFKLLGFKIDITLSLNTNTFKPYHNEHETPNYINVDCNHLYYLEADTNYGCHQNL